MNELEIFKNEEFGEIRTLLINNEPWFVSKDVAFVLGYSNPRDAISKHVDVEDKGGSKMRHPWRKSGFNCNQRIRIIQPYPFQQATDRKEIQALGYIGSLASNTQNGNIHKTSRQPTNRSNPVGGFTYC